MRRGTTNQSTHFTLLSRNRVGQDRQIMPPHPPFPSGLPRKPTPISNGQCFASKDRPLSDEWWRGDGGVFRPILSSHGVLWSLVPILINRRFNHQQCDQLRSAEVLTFQNKSVVNLHQELIRFSLVSIGIAGANSGMLYVLVGKFHLNYLLAQVIVTGILCVASYFIIEWIFRDKTP